MPVSMKYGKGADEMKANRFFVPLWSNPSPTSSFAAQTINVNLNAYDWFAVRVRFSSTTPREMPLFFFSVDDIGKYIYTVAGDTNRVGTRSITYDMENMTLAISGGYYNGSANNNSIIPLEIYGVKL